MKFLTDELWPSIKRSVRDSGTHWVAVPYISSNAAKRLRLGPGDLLITRFDDQTIKSGQTDPRAILGYLRRRVEVHHSGNLHAKVYVSAKRAVVCSANVSKMSEDWLQEAGIETLDRTIIASARRFVFSLRGEPVGLQWAKSKLRLYSPPKSEIQGRQQKPKGATLWLVALSPTDDFSGVDAVAAERAESRAVTRLKNPASFGLSKIRYSSNWPVAEGHYVIQYVKDGRQRYVIPPARANTVHRYIRTGKPQLMVVVEERKRLRMRSPAKVDAWLRARGMRFRRPVEFRAIRNESMRTALFQLWPGVSERRGRS